MKKYKRLFNEITGIDLPTSRYSLIGFGKDRNGNSLAKFQSPSGKGFSIQTVGNLPETHRIKKKGIRGIDDKDLKVIEKEMLDYVKNYGSKKMR